MPDRITPQKPAAHPLIHVARLLLADLLSTLAFVALYAATGSIAVATGVAIGIGLAQIAYLKFRGHQVDLMQWSSLCLVLLLGGATLLTRNPAFIMLKPTLIYAAIGAVMLRPGWINRYSPPKAVVYAADVNAVFGYVWAALFFATAAANLALAIYASPATWAWFLGVFPIASKVILVAIQYAVTRAIVRRRIRASAELALSNPTAPVQSQA